VNLKIVLVLFTAGLFISACVSQQPEIVVETDSFDFGDVVNGEVVDHDLVIGNDGDASLVVGNVLTSCGCTTATLEPMTIPPGGSANLHIEFDSGAHGPELTGLLTRLIFIASNDPAQPEVQIKFVANILERPTP
jgi:hypothetical protein